MGLPTLSHDRPHLVVAEREPTARGETVATTTVFLTASPCPIGCRMCDLHRFTIPGPVPSGAIVSQIDAALKTRAREGWLKLYNSGNFFDPRSIPPSDYEAIAARCSGFSRLVVENHPKIGADRLRQFRDLLPIRLEVAVGLETVQPRWLSRMGKQMTRDDFDAYARWLGGQGIDVRVFLIIGAPGLSVSESGKWTRLSLRHALAASARHVSLIPARRGDGWGGTETPLPHLTTDALAEIQCQALRDADGRAMVTVDIWDVDPSQPGFVDLQRRNLSQTPD